MKLPVRHSLILTVADALRDGIRQEVWRDYLPGERHLAAQLQVSRPTLRGALKMIAGESWLSPPHRGRRRAIIRHPRNPPTGLFRNVTMLYDALIPGPPFRVLLLIDEIRRALQEHGITLEVLPVPRGSSTAIGNALQTLTRERPSSVWMLNRVSKMVQQWFADRALPVLVNGTCHEGIRLPSVGTDYRAVCSHARHMLARAGYRTIMMISSRAAPAAGDMESEHAVFSEQQGDPAVTPNCRSLHFDGDRNLLARTLDTCLHNADRPLAFLCFHPIHAVAALCHLRQRGCDVPGDVGVLSREYDPVFAWTTPTIAHYRMDIERMARKFARLLPTLIERGSIPVKAYRIIPEYVPGGSCKTLGV